MKVFFLYWVPVLAWALLIFYFSGIPSVRISSEVILNEIMHYAGHFSIYFIFSFLLARAFCKEELEMQKIFWASFIIAGVYAIGDEYHQIFVPGRFPDIKDVVTDWVGIFSALEIFRIRFYKKIPR